LQAVPREDMRVVLSTQIADEARHVVFFDRVWQELGLSLETTLNSRIAALREHLELRCAELFDEILQRSVERLHTSPDDRQALIEAITIYHIMVEGMMGLTGQEVIRSFNEREQTLPGLRHGLTCLSRDEHRHVAFGIRFLAEQVETE